MAIIRFLGKDNTCYQVSTPKNPVLIYLTPDERQMLAGSKEGDCLLLINNNLSEQDAEQVIEGLNTKDPVKTLN
jgi:hypothetical protein